MDTFGLRASRRFGTVSPLRYPGGKAALAGIFADLISGLAIARPCYVEPYAGGAGAGIALLREGLIDHLVINDLDSAVHAFWLSVTGSTSEFIERILEAPLTVEEWLKQREVYRAGDTRDVVSLGFAFFYLNRTNRSGVLRGGLIGGLRQQGSYKMDARFNRETLASRISALGELSGQITVSDLDGRTVIRKYSADPSVFMYIDPPYVRAGSRLYLNSFDTWDHEALARAVTEIDQAKWLVTYDLSPLIIRLYSESFQCQYELNYSARHPGATQELLIASPNVAEQLMKGSLDRRADEESA